MTMEDALVFTGSSKQRRLGCYRLFLHYVVCLRAAKLHAVCGNSAPPLSLGQQMQPSTNTGTAVRL